MQIKADSDTLNAVENAKSLALCLNKIEEALGWGQATGWSHQEFITLSEKLLDKTGIRLSANTLKRVWGRLPYDSSPSTSTLNALARFLEFENWASFRNSLNGQVDASISNTPQASIEPPGKKRRQTRNLIYILGGTFFLIACVFLFKLVTQGSSASETPLEEPTKVNFTESELVFDARKTSQGVPNTIIFNYDVGDVDATSFQIQQNWDDRLRFDLDPTQNTVSSTYYLPGYWQAKLLADGTVLKETDVYIESDGWLGTINIDPTPIYFRAQELVSNNLEIDEDAYRNAIRNLPRLPSMSYHYVQNFHATLDHLFVEIVLRNGQQGGEAACRFTSLILLGSTGVVSIPLSIPGCVGDLRLRVSDVVVDGANNDLSSFGCDFNKRQKLGIDLLESRALIYLNRELIRTIPYSEPMGDFAGLRAKFHGHGTIESIVVKNPDGDHLLEHGLN